MKTILITGSSRGIGKAIAVLAHSQGYKVIVHGKTESSELVKTQQELAGSLIAAFDVADNKAVSTSIKKLLDEVGTIDVLINNAGVARNFLKDVAELNDEKAVKEYSVNVLGSLHCVEAVLPRMVEKGNCSIVNISSIKGYSNLSTMSTLTFAATKAGVISITKSLAKAYPSVRFNVVAPGYVETDQVKDWNDQTFERINKGTILGRIAQPKEIAPLVMFLASDEASYITGSEFLADGGYSLQGK